MNVAATTSVVEAVSADAVVATLSTAAVTTVDENDKNRMMLGNSHRKFVPAKRLGLQRRRRL